MNICIPCFWIFKSFFIHQNKKYRTYEEMYKYKFVELI